MAPTLRLSIVVLSCVLTAPAAFAVPPSEPAASVSLHIDPVEVPVTMLYHGTMVRVDATVPSQGDVVVVCAGRESGVRPEAEGQGLGLPVDERR